MCRTLCVAKTVGIGYTTSMAVKEIRVPSRGMRQTDALMGREMMSRYIDADALIMALRLEYPMMPMFKENQEEWEIKTEGYRKAEEVIRNAPTIEPKAKVIAQVTFDEEKMREIVKEAVERFKEEYEIEPKHGEWKPFDLTWGRSIWYCTACEESVEVPCDIWTHKPIYNYCPNCGADMRGKGND